MNKKTKTLLASSLSKAIEPPKQKPPKKPLDDILKSYDDSSTQVPKYSSTQVEEKAEHLQISIVSNPERIENNSSTQVLKYLSTQVIPDAKFYRKANAIADTVERELTPAESKVFDQLVRLSIGFNQDHCQVTVRTLMNRTGYGSDKTVKVAIKGLEVKGRIKKQSTRRSPDGDIFTILPYSSTQVPKYSSAEVETTQVLEAESTYHVNTIKTYSKLDDEGAMLLSKLKGIERELTGVENGDWGLVVDALIERARKISARVNAITDLPKLIAEDLRREEIKREAKPAPKPTTADPQIINLIKQARDEGKTNDQDIIEYVQTIIAVGENIIRENLNSV
jgi:hypothetical protein